MSKQWPTVSKQSRGDWRVDLGKVFGKRTVFTRQTEKEAKELASFYSRERERLGKLGASLTPNEILEFVRCKESLNGRSMTDAVEFYMRGNPIMVKSHTLRETIDALIEEKIEKNRRPRTYETSLSRLNTFAKSFGRDGGDVRAFTREVVETWLKMKSFTPATERGYLRELHGLFAFAGRRGWADGNCIAAIDKPSVETQPLLILTVEEVRDILRMADNRDVAGYALQLFTGVRPAEARRLKITNWDRSKQLIYLGANVSKIRRERYVFVDHSLQHWIDHALPSMLNLDFIPPGFDKRRRDLCDHLGIKWGHDILRKTFCSYHLAKHQKPEFTAEQMGHVGGLAVMYRHYRVPVTPEEANKFWALSPDGVIKQEEVA